MTVAPVRVPRAPVGSCPCHRSEFKSTDRVYEHCGSFYKESCLTELAKGTIFLNAEAVSPARNSPALIDTYAFTSWRERIATAVSIHPAITVYVSCFITPLLAGASSFIGVISNSNGNINTGRAIIIGSIPTGIVLGCGLGAAVYFWGRRVRDSYLTGPSIPSHLLENSRVHLLSTTRV